jgi:hypothetical protein
MRPTLVTNPADDEAFATVAGRFVDDGVDGIDEFERRLRTEYPNAAVHERLLSGETVVVWYVYRDGRWVGSRRGGGDDDE